MSKLSDRIENVLNETRILLLGGQVLLGFAYRPYFENSFDQLTLRAQIVQTVGIAIMTLGLVWLLIPAPFHQLADRGEDTTRIYRLTTQVLDWGLLPFALGLSLSAYVISSVMGIRQSGMVATIVGLLALSWWYLLPLAKYDSSQRTSVSRELKQEEEKQRKQLGGTETKEKIKTLLIECRMVLPGVQAMLGFQLTTFFMPGFAKLPPSSQWIHCGGLVATAIATVFIITPAAYHRLAEAGEDTEHFHQVGTRLLVAAMFFLGIGLSADFVVILHKMALPLFWSCLIGLMFLFCSYALWFGATLLGRSNPR